jgi:hypothetical protein
LGCTVDEKECNGLVYASVRRQPTTHQLFFSPALCYTIDHSLTDNENVTAQRAYSALGFQRVGDYRLLLLRPPT